MPQNKSPRRVLIVGLNFSPELTGIGKYTGEFAEWLAMNGIEVRVICAPPYYPDWKVWSEFRNWYSTQLAHEAANLQVYRCPLYVPVKPSAAKRLIHLFSFALSALPVALSQLLWRPSFVVNVIPTYASTPLALLIARLSGARVIGHIQDLEVDAMFEVTGVKGSWLKHVALAIELWMLRRFDQIYTVSSKMQDKVVDKGVARAKVGVFRNWVDLSEIYPLADRSAERQQYRLSENDIVCLYSGNLGRKQGLEVLIAAARMLSHDTRIRFLICGNGEMRARLEHDAADLKNVKFLDLQPRERLNALLNCADIHLIPQRKAAADLVLPSKLGGILASGKPVIVGAGSETELGRILRNCGVCIEPENVIALRDSIADLAGNPAKRAHLGQLGRSVALELLAIEKIIPQFVAENIERTETT